MSTLYTAVHIQNILLLLYIIATLKINPFRACAINSLSANLISRT